jgi:hypothetical protein
VAEVFFGKNLANIIGDAIAAETVDFEPLSIEETMERFGKGDSSDIVFASLRHHQAEIVSIKPRSIGQSVKLPEVSLLVNPSVAVSMIPPAANDLPTKVAPIAEELAIPANFPQRHVFVGLGFKTVEEIQAKTAAELVAMKGIGETLAEKALWYGK